MTQTLDDGTLATLAGLLVDEFVRGGRVRPALPAGFREHYVATLAHLLVKSGDRERYVSHLRAAVAASDADAALDEVGIQADLPLEKFLKDGFSAFSDEELATLGILEIHLEDVAELISEARDGYLGEYWRTFAPPRIPYLPRPARENPIGRAEDQIPQQKVNPEDPPKQPVTAKDPSDSAPSQ